MATPQISDTYFDEADGSLFSVPEPELRARALRHSLLPRLQTVVQHAVGLIREIYGVEALEDSRICLSPHFRSKRTAEIKLLYPAASAGLGPLRSKTKWVAATRRNGKQAELLPFTFVIQSDEEGLCLFFQSQWLTGLGADYHRPIFEFHLEYESRISCLLGLAGVRRDHAWPPEGPVLELVDLLPALYQARQYRLDFGSEPLYYPVPPCRIEGLALRFAFFFPIYDAYVQLAMAKDDRFESNVAALNDWLRAASCQTAASDDDPAVPAMPDDTMAKARGCPIHS